MDQLSAAEQDKLRSLNKKDAGDTSEEDAKIEAERAAAEDKFVSEWAGALLLGPFVPAVFAAFTIPTGQYVLATWEPLSGKKVNCDTPLDWFVYLAIVSSSKAFTHCVSPFIELLLA